ncbi:putative phage tail assembly chaperone [Shewanella marina]|uniref:putative phage tail assembly chaperone n=1 Tax=Shewanella marina TaxID=487319 RepID=UPI000472C2F7|nr:putative phage tail assembly chaperone [Shewanella marina]
MKQTIVLSIANTDFSFNLTVNDHADYVDAIARGGSLCGASHNFAARTVDTKQKEALMTLLEQSPGAEVQIAGALKGEFSPVLDITVKK